MRITLVTGAGRGIGRAIAVALAQPSGRIAVSARSEAQLESAFGTRADFLFEGAEIPAQRRPAKLVVERGRSDRALDHDVERTRYPSRFSELAPPGEIQPRDVQV